MECQWPTVSRLTMLIHFRRLNQCESAGDGLALNRLALARNGCGYRSSHPSHPSADRGRRRATTLSRWSRPTRYHWVKSPPTYLSSESCFISWCGSSSDSAAGCVWRALRLLLLCVGKLYSCWLREFSATESPSWLMSLMRIDVNDKRPVMVLLLLLLLSGRCDIITSPRVRTCDYKINITHIAYTALRSVARNLFRRGTKPGDWGQKSPAGSMGQSPGVVWGEAEDICAC